MAKVKELNVRDLTDTELLRQVLQHVKAGSGYVLRDNGESQAVLLPMDDLEQLEAAKAKKEQAWQRILENLKRVHARNQDVSEEQVHMDVAEAIRAVRQQRN